MMKKGNKYSIIIIRMAKVILFFLAALFAQNSFAQESYTEEDRVQFVKSIYRLYDVTCSSEKVKIATEVYNPQNLAGFPAVSLTRKDIGKFTLENDTLEIISIVGNRIVLEGNVGNLRLINFVSDNEIVKGERDEDGGLIQRWGVVVIPKSVYVDICINKMTYEEFDKLMTLEKWEEITKKDENYQIAKSETEIGNKFILYRDN